ncbi:MAG: rhodanese-like domain-containing protein [Pseudomonadota bacterium]
MGRRISVKGFTGTTIVKVFDLTVARTGISEKEAISEGLDPLVTYVIAGHHSGYYPGAKDVFIKTISERSTNRLLGCQVIGEEGVDKRIDVMATALYNRMTQEDLLQLDLAYAPPYSSARDPIIVSGMLAQNSLAKDWSPITPLELHEKMIGGSGYQLIDVRTIKEVQKEGIIPGAMHIPVDEFRDRINEIERDKEIILYCAIGLRAYLAGRILTMNGFANVKVLSGGARLWKYWKNGCKM